MVTGPVSVWQTEEHLEKDSLIMLSERTKKERKKRKNLQISGNVLNSGNATPSHCLHTFCLRMEKLPKVRDGKLITAETAVWGNMDF